MLVVVKLLPTLKRSDYVNTPKSFTGLWMQPLTESDALAFLPFFGARSLVPINYGHFHSATNIRPAVADVGMARHVYIYIYIIIFFSNWDGAHLVPGADLVNWGPQAKIGMGPYTFAHIYLDQPWGSFFVVMLAAAQWCPIFDVHVIMGLFNLHLLI